LDRCSPKKALEVFESVKVFLGIHGFVYVIGLSHITISKLITAEYKESEIKGEQYIKKIIQIPIILPEWNTYDIRSLIEDLLRNDLINEDYKGIIQDNAKLISEVVEKNPRDVKRFINNFIVAYEINSSNKNIDPAHLLLVQAINVRWNNFYRLMVSSTQEMREEITKYVEMKEETRITQLESKKIQEGFSADIKRVLNDFKLDTTFWKFLEDKYHTLLQIENWEDYRRATHSTKEIPAPKEKMNSDRSFHYGLTSLIFDKIYPVLDRLIRKRKMETIKGNTLLEEAEQVDRELNFSYRFDIALSFLSKLAHAIEEVEQKQGGSSVETKSVFAIIKEFELDIRKVKILMDLFIREDTDLLAPGFAYWSWRVNGISLHELEAFADNVKRRGLSNYDIFTEFKRWIGWS
jgi:hypothetical protein